MLVNSCLTPLAHADGGIITTIEGVAIGRRPARRPGAFLECGGAQCGICTPGMVLAAYDLLSRNPEPTEADVRVVARRQSVPVHRLHAHLRIRAPRVRGASPTSAMIPLLDGYDAGRPRRRCPRRWRSRAASRRPSVRRRNRPDGPAGGGASAARPLRQPLASAASCAASSERRRRRLRSAR